MIKVVISSDVDNASVKDLVKDIEAYVYESWYWQGEAENVEFYIDDVLKANITSEPYSWTWTDKTFGRHTIKVVAYDDEGNSASDEIKVWKFL